MSLDCQQAAKVARVRSMTAQDRNDAWDPEENRSFWSLALFPAPLRLGRRCDGTGVLRARNRTNLVGTLSLAVTEWLMARRAEILAIWARGDRNTLALGYVSPNATLTLPVVCARRPAYRRAVFRLQARVESQPPLRVLFHRLAGLDDQLLALTQTLEKSARMVGLEGVASG
jgi:hypothetical protein